MEIQFRYKNMHLCLVFSILCLCLHTFTFGLSVPELKSAFPGQIVHRVDAPVFQQFVKNHGSQGQLYTQSNPTQTSDSPVKAPRALQELEVKNRIIDSLRTADSLSRSQGHFQGKSKQEDEWHRHGLDTLIVGAKPDASENEGRTQSYATNFFLDAVNWGGDWKLGGDEWAVVIYVVVGAVVVSAFVLYGPYLFYQLIANEGDDPVFHEIGLRYSFSGKTWADGGPPLYRNANLLGLRYAVGLDKNGFGLGLAAEGGYINLSLKEIQDPTHAFDFKGGYLVGGPMVRFGNNRPASLTLEFLNGTSDHASIGWISKSRMTIQGKFGPSGLLVGAHIGAVFYDLQFYDGLVQRRGDFNRDLSLIMGIDTGWEF